MAENILNSRHMIYTVVNRQGLITFVNKACLELLQSGSDDVMGRHISEVMPGSRLPEVLETGESHEFDTGALNGRDLVTALFPIMKDGIIVGAVSNSIFLDAFNATALASPQQESEKCLYYYKDQLRHPGDARWHFFDLIGENPDFVKIKTMARQLARTPSTVLITGESGTGKELFAQAIHNSSNRAGPFIRINCPALPENLLESELFGYEEGAFTGARKGGKPGRFELARGGTVFLDEIGDMPFNMQTKLLSVLQERVIERVGGTSPVAVNVRVIAATNRSLEEMVASREFREDLYYRLNVVRLDIPPLRERSGDIPLLADHLITRINSWAGKGGCSGIYGSISNITSRALKMLCQHYWPGNVRELENLLERGINLAALERARVLDLEHFPSLDSRADLFLESPQRENCMADHRPLSASLELVEKEIIEKALRSSQQNKTRAARLLGLNKSAFYRKLRKYGLNSQD